MHPPKQEIFDVAARTNTDPKGFVRAVSEYREESFGLYMSRSMVGHPRCHWVESWLLPELGIRVTDWWLSPGEQPDQDFYIDIVQIAVEPGGQVWRTTDHYLDVVLHTRQDLAVLDVDEFASAVQLGLLDATVAEQALHRTFEVVTGLTKHDNDLDAWLAGRGITLTWRPR